MNKTLSSWVASSTELNCTTHSDAAATTSSSTSGAYNSSALTSCFEPLPTLPFQIMIAISRMEILLSTLFVEASILSSIFTLETWPKRIVHETIAPIQLLESVTNVSPF